MTHAITEYVGQNHPALLQGIYVGGQGSNGKQRDDRLKHAHGRMNQITQPFLRPTNLQRQRLTYSTYQAPLGYHIFFFRQQIRETIAGRLASSLEPPHPRDLLVRLCPGTEEAPDFETTCQCRPRRHPLQPWRTRTSLPPSHLSRPLPAEPLLPLSMADHGRAWHDAREEPTRLQKSADTLDDENCSTHDIARSHASPSRTTPRHHGNMLRFLTGMYVRHDSFHVAGRCRKPQPPAGVRTGLLLPYFKP